MIAIFPPAHTYIPKGVWGSSFEAGNKMKWKAHATFWAVQEKTNTNPQKEHKYRRGEKKDLNTTYCHQMLWRSTNFVLFLEKGTLRIDSFELAKRQVQSTFGPAKYNSEAK